MQVPSVPLLCHFQIQETDEARKKFSNAKSISSSQFFGDQNKDAESQVSLHKFSVSALTHEFQGIKYPLIVF